MDATLAVHAVLIAGMGVLFILAFRLMTSVNGPHRRKLIIWYFLLLIAWLGMLYRLKHTEGLSADWVDTYQSCSQCISFAWPYLAAQVSIRQRYAPIIILKPTSRDITMKVIGFMVLIWITFSYGLSHYVKVSGWNLIWSILAWMSTALVGIVMVSRRVSIYADGISIGGFFLVWSDFKSYSWQGDKLLLKIKMSRPLRLAIPPEQREKVEDLVRSHIRE